MHSNPSFTIRCRVQEGSLNEQMFLVGHQSAPLRPIIVVSFTFKFIDNNSVFVNNRAQDQIISLFLDQKVAISADLIKAC